MKTLQFFILGTFAAGFAGCATAPPTELINARSAYQRASEGPAQQLAPAELHKAHESLNLAEQSFMKEPDSYKTKDLAYVAQRKSEQAGALGVLAAARGSKDRANADFQNQQTELVKQGKQDLSDSEKRAAAAQAELVRQADLNVAREKADADSQRQQAQIDQGNKDLRDAERQTAAAQSELVRQAEMKAAKERADADVQRQQDQIAQGNKDLRDAERQTAAAQSELVRQAEMKAAKERADADFQRQQAQIAQGKQDLYDAEKRTADTQAELDKQAVLKTAKDQADAELQKQQADILQGKQDLRDSEKRTADALAQLATLASLKEEKRGLVLTLSGSILFRSAQSTLLPQAEVKLDQVATSLLAIRTRNLIVEGHTDSQGSEQYNQSLSQRRADAVRDYLVQRGYPANQIQARGRSESSPIADNASAEGRANNRRVEIVIEREVRAPK